jgi:hypothetical protein
MSCQDCKKKGSVKINFMFILGIELALTAIYGHIVLIKEIVNWISRLY